MVKVFNNISYDIPRHVVDRWMERVSDNFSRSQAVFTLDCILRKSRVILDSGKYRYLKFNDLTFTCIKTGEKLYVVTTILTKDMTVRDYA